MQDRWGREILSETFDGGFRYFDAAGTISTALPSSDIDTALGIFNNNPPPDADLGAVLSADEFLAKFTTSEIVGILQAKENDAQTQALYARFLQGEIHMRSPALEQGLGYLVAIGVLSSERKQEILT